MSGIKDVGRIPAAWHGTLAGGMYADRDVLPPKRCFTPQELFDVYKVPRRKWAALLSRVLSSFNIELTGTKLKRGAAPKVNVALLQDVALIKWKTRGAILDLKHGGHSLRKIADEAKLDLKVVKRVCRGQDILDSTALCIRLTRGRKIRNKESLKQELKSLKSQLTRAKNEEPVLFEAIWTTFGLKAQKRKKRTV